MGTFKLKGNSILYNSSSCTVEVISDSVETACDNFFKSKTNNGKVNIPGVTDSGYHLVTPDSGTTYDTLKQDVFSSKLKVSGTVKKYCAKGKAPLGTLLAEYGPGTYYFFRRYDGYCELQDKDGATLLTLSSQGENRRIYFAICGGGGSGCSGASGMGWWGGGGGAGAGGAILTLEFTEKATTSSQNLKLKIVVGSGGSGRSPSAQGGYAGGSTTITPVTAHSSFGTDTLATASGGSGNSGKSTASAGGASVDDKRKTNEYYYIVDYVTCSGGKGGSEAQSGSGVDKVYGYNYTVNSKHIEYIGNTSGGGKSGGGNGGGGGGASPFANGNSESSGAGGHGGEGAFFSGSSSQSGGAGFLKIYY